MRLNLNFKDAQITKITKAEFKIVFDISNMIKPRLSTDARMYIEHLNLPEFIDDKWGRENGDLFGYFELRCNNLDNNDYDSQYGNNGNNILYRSPLNNFGSFTNTEPMFISNFKISQNFLSDKLVFMLKLFDKNGNDFETATSVVSEVDITSADYATYNSYINELQTLSTNLSDAETIYNDITATIKSNIPIVQQAYKTFEDKRLDLILEMDKLINDGRRNKCSVFQLKYLRNIITTGDFQTQIYFFETQMPKLIRKEPFTLVNTEINDYYVSYIEYHGIVYQNKDQNLLAKKINSKDTNIFYEYAFQWTDPAISIHPDTKTSLAYTVPASTPAKTGTIDIEYFNSVDQGRSYTIITDITPASGDDNILDEGDILFIDKSNFKKSMMDTFDYAFCQTSATPNLDITFNKADGSAFILTDAKQVRYSLIITRTPTEYQYKFTEDVDTKGMLKDATMTIKGSLLDGVDGVNDLVIKIDEVVLPENSKTYQKVITDDDHGTMTVDIIRDNTTVKYSIVSGTDFSQTKGYSVGNTIDFKGSEFDGADGLNDATLIITKVVQNLDYKLDETDCIHSIKKIEIRDDDIDKITDTSGTVVSNRKDIKFVISSADGDYTVEFDDSADTSTNFATGDLIYIKGSKLTGEDGVNDVVIEVENVDATSKKITALKIEDTSGTTYKARNVSDLTFQVNVLINNDKYEVENFKGNNFQEGDEILVGGKTLGGEPNINTLTITIPALEPLTPTSASSPEPRTITNLDIQGTANPRRGEMGEIITMSIIGTPRQFFPEGVWKPENTSKVSGTPVDLTTFTSTTDLEIELVSKLDSGLENIKNEITTKNTQIYTAKSTLPLKKTTYVLDLDGQVNKLKCFNLSLILYDEVPEYASSSFDSIKGNTYSRLTGCQFRRI